MMIRLEKVIHDLEKQKNELLDKIQKSGWKDNRPNQKIPQHQRESLDHLITSMYVVPEKSPLPANTGRLYQRWYSAARVIIAKNQPDRFSEFNDIYSSKIKSGTITGVKTLIEKRYLTKDEQFRLMDLINSQFEILAAVPSHIRYSLYDIELTAYSVLMDDEIEAARHLLSKGFLRAAGAITGVILERHLKNLLRKHTPPIKHKKKDTLNKLNDLCKDNVYDLITWREVQHLTDLRNLCDHDRAREPTKEEVEKLIKGVSTILKTNNPHVSGKSEIP